MTTPAEEERSVPMLRTSERTTWRRCPQKWWWHYREGLSVKDHATPNALWFGTGIHLALAGWYTGPGIVRGVHPAETFEAWATDETRRIKVDVTRNGEFDDTEWVSARDLGVAMLNGYIEHFGADQHMDVISPEQTFAVNIPKIKPAQGTLVVYVGTFDLVYRDLNFGNSIWLGEHKSFKAVQTNHLPLDDQTGAYWTVAGDTLRAQGLIDDKARIDGICYNILRKAMPDPRPRNEFGSCLNKDGSVSKVQPAQLFYRENVYRTRKERQTQIRRIQAEATVMAAQVAGTMPLWKNPTKDCSFDCSLREMCELHEQQVDWEEYRDAAFTVIDPYADHHKSAAE